MKLVLLGIILSIYSSISFSDELYMRLVDNNNKPNGYLTLQDFPCVLKVSDSLINKLKGDDVGTAIVLYNATITNANNQTRNSCWFRPQPIEGHESLVVVLEEYSDGMFNIGSFGQYYFKKVK